MSLPGSLSEKGFFSARPLRLGVEFRRKKHSPPRRRERREIKPPAGTSRRPYKNLKQEPRVNRFALAFFFVLISPKLMDFANKGISIIGSKDGKTLG